MKLNVSKLTLVAAASLAMFITSCGDKKGSGSAADTPDSVTDELLVKMDELADAIGGVTDKASAEEAATKIDKIGDEFLDIAKRLEALDEPSEDEKKALDEKMSKAMDAKQEKMVTAMKSLMNNPEVAPIIFKAMEDFGKKVDRAEETFKKFGKKKK